MTTKIQHEIIHIKSAREPSNKSNATSKCRRAIKKGSIGVARWYNHKDRGDFFILVNIGGLEFRSVNNYPSCPDAKKVADIIKKSFFEC